MSKKNKKEAKEKVSRKKIALVVFAKLDTALKDYQAMIGEKKFVGHLKKTAKTLAVDITDASKKMKERLEKEIQKDEKKRESGKVFENKIMKQKRTRKTKIKEPLTEVSLQDQEASEEEED